MLQRGGCDLAIGPLAASTDYYYITSCSICTTGRTGQLCVFTPDERQAYEKHCKVVLEALVSVGRLERARAIEASMFGLGAHEHAADSAGHPNVKARARRCLQNVKLSCASP
jgi:hypothetical protein